jgi:hypothetical protein
MTILRFPLDRARPSRCGRIVCCEAAEVVVLEVPFVERFDEAYLRKEIDREVDVIRRERARLQE